MMWLIAAAIVIAIARKNSGAPAVTQPVVQRGSRNGFSWEIRQNPRSGYFSIWIDGTRHDPTDYVRQVDAYNEAMRWIDEWTGGETRALPTAGLDLRPGNGQTAGLTLND